VLVLGATNRLDRLDPAVLRPGRFDEVIELPAPDQADRKAILEIHLRDKALAADINIDDLAARTDGLSGAELSWLCNQAAHRALRRAIARTRGREPVAVTVQIEAADLDDAFEQRQ
jgi:transitional endoplasmic reticulum ATPase